MKHNILHILFLILGPALTALTQTMPNWDIQVDIDSAAIVMNSSTVSVDKIAVATGDYIGAFIQNGSIETCIGAAEWQDSSSRMTIYLSSDTGGTIANVGDLFYLKHWDSQRGCTYASTTNSSSENTIFSGAVISTGNIESIYLIPNISYETAYDASIESIEPLVMGNDLFSYSIINSQVDVSIDTISGLVIPNAQDTGQFTVVVNSEICIEDLSFLINLTDTTESKIDTLPDNPLPSDEEFYLSPYSDDPRYQTFLIEGTEKIEIFDKNGRLIISNDGSFLWDGKDQNNNFLPSDDYYIKIGDSAKIITILN